MSGKRKMNVAMEALRPEEAVRVERERGASLVEYALLVGLITVVAIVAVRVLGQTVSGQFSAASVQLSNPGGGPIE